MHSPDCPFTKGSGTLSIVSPSNGQKYVLGGARENHSNGAILLQATGGEKHLYWFVDGELFARSTPGERTFWTPTKGSHQIRCVDATGRSATSKVRIK